MGDQITHYICDCIHTCSCAVSGMSIILKTNIYHGSHPHIHHSSSIAGNGCTGGSSSARYGLLVVVVVLVMAYW